MNKTIAFRITEQRKKMLDNIRKKFRTNTVSEAIDIALKACLSGEKSYIKKVGSVKGILKDSNDSVSIIRNMRGGNVIGD
ncbi:MAG: hypothetical protein ABII23_07590 [bacterium]